MLGAEENNIGPIDVDHEVSEVHPGTEIEASSDGEEGAHAIPNEEMFQESAHEPIGVDSLPERTGKKIWKGLGYWNRYRGRHTV